MVLNTEWAQVEVIDLVNDGSGLAFGIIGGRSTGVVVKTILPGGVADRDGRLQSGDHILQIGEVNLRGLGSEQVASVLRQCGIHVRMVVARPVESTSTDYQTLGSHAPIVPTKILGDPVELDKHLIENGFTEAITNRPSNFNTPYIYTEQESDIQMNPISGLVDVVKNPLPIGKVPLLKQLTNPAEAVIMLPLDMALRHEPNLPETETFSVELTKDDLGLGITVAGYVCEKEEISGIFVKSLSKGSAAEVTKKIKVNDRIIQVNGKSIVGQTNHQSVEILRNAGPIVVIQFERYLRGPKYEQLQQAIKANELRPPSPPSPSISSLPKVPLSFVHMSHLGIEPEGESRTSFDFDSSILVENANADNDENEIVFYDTRSVKFSLDSRESIYEKWKDQFKDDVEIVIADMHKEYIGGLGISLEGTVDVEDGKEVRPHHYIRNILADGPVGRNGTLQAGDELLEVNGIKLLGLNHLEVVSILKQLPNFVIMICARYPVPIRIIDTSQRREAFQARKILAGSLQTLIPTNDRLVKAKSESSLASSVTSDGLCNTTAGSRSRSLEMVTGFPMWKKETTMIELSKGEHGLGFSILDYQDPLNPQETVIVIRSLVPGGVAQNDGRLIPGDRLIAVNDIDVEHATLDQAVQILKGAPRGTVRVTVAKPLTSNDALSYTSQDTEDDQTCLEDFQECIEEYQECLEVVHICIDDDNTSPCTSQVEDFGRKRNTNAQNNNNLNGFLGNNYLAASIKTCDSIGVSDLDLSYNSTNSGANGKLCSVSDGTINLGSVVTTVFEKALHKTDSLTLSDKASNVTQSSNQSEKDGYETCIDESLSEDYSNKKHKDNEETEPRVNNHKINIVQNISQSIDTITVIEEKTVHDVEDVTPTNSKLDLNDQSFVDFALLPLNVASAPCSKTSSETLLYPKTNHLLLDTKHDYELKSYDNDSGGLCSDEFFLVQYPPDRSKEVIKSYSDPNVLDSYVLPLKRKLTYRKCLKEYYNDYEDCLELYKGSLPKDEMNDDAIFNDIMLPFKSKSAPDIMDSSFVMITYDPGPERYRRKSAFVSGHQGDIGETGGPMTVIRPIDYGTMKERHVSDMLQKHWGSTHCVKVFREPNTSLGISIVGGKVDLHSENTEEALLGIFVKNVVPNSPAGKTGQFKTGDRILEVSGVDVQHINHEKAVDIIRNSASPVVFIVQSLIPWIENEDPIRSNKCPSPLPSPVNTAVPVIFSEGLHKNEPKNGVPEKFRNDNSKNEEPVTIISNQVNGPEKFFGEIVSTPSQVEPTSCVDLASSSVVSTPDSLADDKIDMGSSADQSDEDVDDDDDDEEDVRMLEGRTISPAGMQIDRASAGNVQRTKEEIDLDPEKEDDFGYTTNKVKKKYANLGHSIMMVQLERSNQGLGLSLAGHKDRNCMAVFVCGLNPKGMAHKMGGIQVGDEILEVNGVVLHGRCHLNASAIIKGLSGPIFKVIILRRKAAIDDIAVKPITQFPISLAEEASEEQFSASYPNVRTVAIKKGTQSLGIMIIEGKHAEIGQGIFISDIQEGSSAEKAGLEIGEMILAVNKDTIIGSNYDTAANLLKRTEGLVTLVVSNPGKKEAGATVGTNDQNAKNATVKTNALKAAAPPSRPTTPVPEPVADPFTCSIGPGTDVTIEVVTDNKGLGVFFVGGRDTLIPNGIVIVEVYPGGTVDKDGRLRPGDQILDVNGVCLKNVTNTTALQAMRQTLPKMKIVVFRPDKIEYTTIDVDLVKKPGKGLGLSVIAKKSGKGVYIADIINGGLADVDGRIVRGDLLISVNGQDVDSSPGEEAGAILKTVTGRVSLKLYRYKPTAR